MQFLTSLTSGQELFSIGKNFISLCFLSTEKVMILLKQFLLGKCIQNVEQMFPRAGGESIAKTFHKPLYPGDLSKLFEIYPSAFPVSGIAEVPSIYLKKNKLKKGRILSPKFPAGICFSYSE